MAEKSHLLDEVSLEEADAMRARAASNESINATPQQPAAATNGKGKGRGGLTGLLVLSVSAAVVGSSTQFGYNTGVINNPKQAIYDSYNSSGSILQANFTSLEVTFSVAIFAIGGMLGALPAGFIADHLGRKYTMMLNNIVVVIAVCLQSFAVHPIMFIIGRFVVGINSGINTVVVPMYISEISPIRLRGAMGVCHQMAVTVTILLSQFLGLSFVLGRPDSDHYGWRILFAFPLLFVIFQISVLPLCPESPRFLFIKRLKEDAAAQALIKLRGTDNIQDELKAMKEELEELQNPKEKVTMKQFIVRPSLRLPLLISIVLHLSQQLTGIGGVLYYSNDVFLLAGVKHADIATVVVVGLTLVTFTIVTVFLIEVLGRRTLMLYGVGGMAIFFTFLTSMFCFEDGFYSVQDSRPAVTVPGILLVISSLGITALFSLGPGAIPWLMVSELFLQEARPLAVTIATIVNWLANFIVGLAFPYILQFLYPYGTAVFIVICTLVWIYLYIYLPETKGRSVDDITMGFRKRTGEIGADSSVNSDTTA